jgi:cellulose synthase/poly-beta-1,6-N-acetylglucosamine synthase-like glycosyltransferase
VAVSAGATGLVDAYLLLLLAAAAWDARRPRAAPAAADPPEIVVLVPAHDEEAVIAATVRTLAALDHPRDRLEVVVVADNCRDATARVATEAGATLWEREDRARPGKGAALEWAFGRLLAERPRAGVAIVVDADCAASPDLATAVADRMAGEVRAVQVSYLVANPGHSPGTALRYAAFASMNHVRPRGRSALGLSAGLLGTGMAFRRDLLERVPWHAGGLVEDLEHHVRLVEAGERVAFAPEAAVTSPMPTAGEATDVQESRWERGRLEVARQHAPRLIGDGLRRGDARRLQAALDLLIPPQSILAAATAAVAGVAGVLRMPRAASVAVAGLLSQGALAIGGLALVRAPAAAYSGLLAAPALVVRKLRVYARIALGRGPSRWERTPREPG